MLDFFTVWWENTCSGLDRRTKADKRVQHWIGRFEKGGRRMAAGIFSYFLIGFRMFLARVRCTTVRLLFCTFHLALPKGLEGHPGQDQLHGCRCKDQGQEHWRTSSGTGTFRSSDFGRFRAGFLSKVLKVGSQALSGLGGRPEEDEFVWCWIERFQKAYWEDAAGDQCRCLKID